MNDSCMACGRNTAPGTPLFSSRKRAVDSVTGVEGVLCEACQPGSAGLGAEQETPQSGRYIVFV